MSKIRVLHVYKTSLPETKGGVEYFIDTLCRSSDEHNIENTVFSLSDTPQKSPIKMNGYQVYQAKRNFNLASTGFSLSAIRMFSQLTQEADIIHYHFPNPFSDLLHFLCRVKKPTVVTYHSDIVRQKNLLKLYQPLQARFLRSVDRIVATSPTYFSSSLVLQQFSDKVKAIPIGIHLNDYVNLDQNRLRFWKNRFSKPFFLFVGVLRYYKGLHFLLEAVKDTSIPLVIAGFGDKEDELKRYVKKHNMTHVEFLGGVSHEDKMALLSLCSGFVFPSHLRSEAFGIALLEAAAFSKPLICCEIKTGTSYINVNGLTGIVVEPESPDKLRDAMLCLLNNPDKAKIMGMNARKRVDELFTVNRQDEAYRELYHEILSNHGLVS